MTVFPVVYLFGSRLPSRAIAEKDRRNQQAWAAESRLALGRVA